MKRLALLLVIANLGFFAWRYWLADPPRGGAHPLPIDAAPSLDRLDEVDLTEFARRTPASSAAAGARIAEGACFAVGPMTGEYSEGAVMGRVREWLMSRGGNVDLRRGRYREIRYYWLHLPPVGTYAAAQDRVRELTASAFANAAAIPDGNMKNAVTIGIYGLRSVLERDLARLKAKGFEPRVEPVLRTGRSLWFNAEFPPGYEFPAKRFGVAFAGLDVVDARCPPPPEPPTGAPSTVPPPVSTAAPAAPGPDLRPRPGPAAGA